MTDFKNSKQEADAMKMRIHEAIALIYRLERLLDKINDAECYEEDYIDGTREAFIDLESGIRTLAEHDLIGIL